jgi:EpsI family protein
VLRGSDTVAARVVVGVLLAAGVVYAHWEPLAAMVGMWSRSPMYSYAYSVPFISAYLLWTQRGALARLSPTPSPIGAAAVLTGGLLMLFVGSQAGVQVLEQLAFLVCLVGIVLGVFGAGYIRAGWAGLAYLLLMIPLWDAFTEPLHLPFQNQSAALGIHVLHLVGIPAHREGILITLPNISLEVARACSGINYVVAVVALGLPLSYLSLPGIWRPMALVAGSVAIAALSNGLRVSLIGILAYFEIGSPLHGPMHVLHGLFVAGVGYAAIFAGLRLLGPRSGPIPGDTPQPNWTWPRVPVAPMATLAVLFWVVACLPLVVRTSSVPPAAHLDSLPLHLGGWVGQPIRESYSSLPTAWTGADIEIRRRYSKSGHPPVEVFVAYFPAQRRDAEVVNYRTADLHRRASTIEIALREGTTLQVNLVRDDAQSPGVGLFWYEIDGTPESQPYAAKLRTLRNSLLRRRSNAAVVLLTTNAARGEPASPSSMDVPRASLTELAGLLYEALGPGRGRQGPVAQGAAR